MDSAATDVRGPTKSFGATRALDGFALRVEPGHAAKQRTLALMLLHLALQPLNLLLQLTACALEGVVEREVETGVALVLLRRAINLDRAPIGQCEMNGDFVEPSGAVVVPRRLQHHAPSGDAAEKPFERGHFPVNRRAYVGPRVHALKSDLNRCLHRALSTLLCPDNELSRPRPATIR